MGILQRYIVLELLKVFLVSLLALTSVMLIAGLGKQAIKEGLTPLAVLQLIPYLLPGALRFAMPATMLFAACNVYGRASASNEFSALKAVGISPLVLIGPGLVLALVLSVVAVWLNDVAMSWGHHGARRVLIQSLDDVIYGVLKTRKSFQSDRISILVRGVEQDVLIRPELTLTEPRDGSVVSITAAQAKIRTDPERREIIVELTNSQIRSTGPKSHQFEHPGRFVTTFPLESPSAAGLRDVVHQPMWQLPDLREMMQVHHMQISRMLFLKGAAHLVSGQLPASDDLSWRYWVSEQRWSAAQVHRLASEPHRRWANGFSCFCFTLLGIPLAIRRRSADFVSSFFAAFLPVLLLYYPLMAWGVDRAKDGMWPPVVWLGNLALLIVGGFLLVKTIRH